MPHLGTSYLVWWLYLISWVWWFPEHLVWDRGFGGLRHLRWFYYCHHSQWNYWTYLIFSWFSFLIPTLAFLVNLGHYWLLEYYWLLIVCFLFSPDLYSLHYFEPGIYFKHFDPGHYLHHFEHHYLHYDWDSDSPLLYLHLYWEYCSQQHYLHLD